MTRSHWATRAATAFVALACALTALSIGSARAEDAPGSRRRPLAVGGFEMPDGSWVFPHVGLVRPPAAAQDPASRWTLQKAGARRWRGRAVDAYRYARDGVTTGADEPVTYVDPTTGWAVGGGDDVGESPEPAGEPACASR